MPSRNKPAITGVLGKVSRPDTFSFRTNYRLTCFLSFILILYFLTFFFLNFLIFLLILFFLIGLIKIRLIFHLYNLFLMIFMSVNQIIKFINKTLLILTFYLLYITSWCLTQMNIISFHKPSKIWIIRWFFLFLILLFILFLFLFPKIQFTLRIVLLLIHSLLTIYQLTKLIQKTLLFLILITNLIRNPKFYITTIKQPSKSFKLTSLFSLPNIILTTILRHQTYTLNSRFLSHLKLNHPKSISIISSCLFLLITKMSRLPKQ